MATVNLGNIKLNWKGAYNSSTAYIVDDVVSYNGSSYVCILASTGNLPTVTTYWNQMSAAGTDGTDVGTTITTQGDILYRDGSGLARLAAGTNGHVLTTGGSGANPTWAAAVGGKVLQMIHGGHTPQASTTSTNPVDVSSNTNVSITPSATSSKILVFAHFNELYHSSSTNSTSLYIRVMRDSTEVAKAHTIYTSSISGEEMWNQDFIFVDQPSSTSALAYKLQFWSANGQSVRVNQNSNAGGTTITLLEIGA